MVVNLGTNDFSTNIYPLEDEFIHAYKLLISRLRANYGDVPILCISPAITQRQIVQYMERMRKDLNDKKVYIAVLPEGLCDPTTDLGAVWHPNYKGQMKMAMSLIPYMSTITGWPLKKEFVLLRLTMLYKLSKWHFVILIIINSSNGSISIVS